MRPLLVIEGLSLAAFLGLAIASVSTQETPVVSIDIQALAVGEGNETWMGIYFQDQHIGYAVNREIPASDGRTLYQVQSRNRIGSMGTTNTITVAGTGIVTEAGLLDRFDFLVHTEGVLSTTITGHGEMRGKLLHMDYVQGGEAQVLDLELPSPPVVSATLTSAFVGRTYKPGLKFTVPYFDFLTRSESEMMVSVEAPEILANGDTAWWLRINRGGVEVRQLIDEAGRVVREVSDTGFRSERMTREAAIAIDKGDPPDMVAMAAAPVTGGLAGRARSMGALQLQVEGVEASRFAHEPPVQTVEGDRVRVVPVLLAELPELPVVGDHDLDATPSLPTLHEEIRAKAAELVAGATTRLDAAQRIAAFVRDHVRDVPVVGVPNGLEVLRSGQGDCNEHTALFVSLARAAGIPSRIAAGMVYSEKLGNAFYYHAWPEVALGGPTGWVAIDPTFGQFPADATHLKVVNGDLDQQVAIMSLIGRVRFALIEPAPGDR